MATDGGSPPLSPSFRRFLWARLFGNAALQMVLVALGWQVYALTASAWDLGLVGLLQFLPALVLTIPAGQLIDRVGLKIMVGSMVATSLAMAPALLVAQDAEWVDLDGPLLLAHDREPGLVYDGATVSPPGPDLWG